MKRSLTLLAMVVAVAAGAGYWYVQGKLPQREGEVAIAGLQAPVSVRYDARGVPHLRLGETGATSEDDAEALVIDGVFTLPLDQARGVCEGALPAIFG